jgi:hypothetical protein
MHIGESVTSEAKPSHAAAYSAAVSCPTTITVRGQKAQNLKVSIIIKQLRITFENISENANRLGRTKLRLGITGTDFFQLSDYRTSYILRDFNRTSIIQLCPSVKSALAESLLGVRE